MKKNLFTQNQIRVRQRPPCRRRVFSTKRCLLMVAFLSGVALSADAQSVVAAGGGTSKGKQVSLEWTLGELCVETVSTTKGIHTQGFHQPLLIRSVTLVAEASSELPDHFFKVAPNPVVNSFVVSVVGQVSSAVGLQLADAQGRIIFTKSPSQNKTFNLSLANQAAGTYFLFVRDEKGLLLKTFSIIKSNSIL